MCTSLNEVLEVFKEEYSNVRSLLEKNKTCEPNEQFTNNYAAVEILNGMKSTLDTRIEQRPDDSVKEKSMLAAVLYLHACVSMDVDESSTGEDSLNKSLALINDDPYSSDNILTYISCYNQLGLLWCERACYDKALVFLKDCERFYKEYDGDEPVEFERLLTGEEGKESGELALEKLHTLTLYYLAQALGASGDPVSAAAYCHKTLKRQLDAPCLDKADWALNAATLSQVLVERNAFKEARSHLIAALVQLQRLRVDLDKDPDPDTDRHKAELEILSEREAEVSRCWAKYCLNLLAISKDRLLDDSFQLTPTPDELRGLEFEDSGESVEGAKVSYNFALTWEDALAIFKEGCSWIEHATQHYTLDNHASDYVSIVRDHSQLYMALAFFSDDLSKQRKMHRKRLDMLKHISDKLNPTYYIDLLRQIWFEMGEIHLTLIDLKADQVSSDRNDFITKMNNLVKQGVTIFQKFINSFDDQKNSERYAEGYERSVLLAKIHVAKLLMQIKTDDSNLLVQYNTISYNNYKEIVAYCDKWKGAEALTEGELHLCREMSNLLPLKLSKLLTRDS